jgi:allantoicase
MGGEENNNLLLLCEISSSHGGEYEVQICLLGCNAVLNNFGVITLLFEGARTSETSVDNYFTRQYIPEDKSELLLLIPN